jgi:putative endopeptidase
MASSTEPPGPHNIKCPCCNNPWATATGDFFARICQECEETSTVEKGLSRSNMDFSVHPRNDFYLYANGNWLKNNPIPAGYPNWNSFLTLHVKSQENLKQILEELASSEQVSEEQLKVSAFYKAAMNEDVIEQAGIVPLQPLLDECMKAVNAASADDKKGYANSLGNLAYKYSITPFFAVGVSPDKMDSDHSIAQLSQSGLGLPDRDYYFDDDKEEKRDAYKQSLAMFLTLLDDPTATEPTPQNVDLASKVYELEKSLAEAHMTRTENRDPHATYNKMTVDELMTLGETKFDFGSYFIAAAGPSKSTVEEVGDINVRNIKAIEKAVEVATSTDQETLSAYLKWNVVSSCAPYLSKAFVDQHFEFYEKTLMGTTEIKDRWKRAMSWTESALGEALGKLYCEKYFDESSKQQALDIVEQVRKALEDRLKEVDWIKAESTREQALKKMEKFRVKIGYPDEWIDYTPLHIDPTTDTFLDMVLKAREFSNFVDNKEMNAPTDKKKWVSVYRDVVAYEIRSVL